MSRIELRTVSGDDWETWRDLRLQALAEAPYAFGSTLADWQDADEERWRDRLGWGDGTNLVVLLDGEPAAMASGIPDGDAVVVISMWVAPVARGRGAGDLLLSTIEELARSGGAVRMLLDVAEGNGAAMRLYERHGFVPTDETDGHERTWEKLLQG